MRGVSLNMIELSDDLQCLAVLLDRNAHAVARLGHGALQPRAGLLDAGVVVVAVLRNLRAVVAAVLRDGSGVAGTVLVDQRHQVAALLQDVRLLIAARLHDLPEQRLTVLLQQGDVGLAELVDQGLLTHGWGQFAEVAAGRDQVVVIHQVVGAHACRAA